MELWVGAINLGLLYAFMTMGVFITFRIHDFADITVDGSFTLGAAVAAVLLVSGVDPFPALLAAFLTGAAAGAVTAIIHTRLNINGLLAGILVMTGLYSVNLHIMGRSNIPLIHQKTFLTYLEKLNPGLHQEIWTCMALCAVITLFWLVTSLFFKTDFGIAMRATGNNPTMAAAAGVNVAGMKTFGIALANGLVGLSGGLVAQYQGFADVGMGIGTIVVGLAAVIIGESTLRKRSIYLKILSVILGSILFRLMIAFALSAGMNPIDLKLLTAVFVLFTLVVSKSINSKEAAKNIFAQAVARLSSTGRRSLYSLGCLVVILGVGLFAYHHLASSESSRSKVQKIGVLQLTDSTLLNITRDSFVEEMKRLGCKPEQNCIIRTENANGDMPTVSTILDKFLRDGMDIVVPISTGCTQAAINKIKDRPIVFATVANPFLIEAGKSDTEHLPNVTGVYGWVPMEKTMEVVRQILPGKLRIGSLWDPSQANAVFNVDGLRKAIEADTDVTFVGTTVAGSSEVYQGALSLVEKGIDVFVLPPDTIVYAAFESVLKAAENKNIPIFLSDVERISDGAFCALGYDYTSSGIQAAHIVDRVLKGEKPANIPFERYRNLTLAINTDVMKKLGLKVPEKLMAEATLISSTGISSKAGKDVLPSDNAPPSTGASSQATIQPSKPRKLALFLFNDNIVLREGAQGVMEELEDSGILKKYNITVDMKNAQNEFPIAQSVAQDIVRQKYDYVITVSTPALQIMAQVNRTVPHVFGVVTDPYRMGVASSAESHLPILTGVATLQPVDATLKAMREMFPNAGKIGIVWNPGEACSEACTYQARESAGKYGFELLEANVGSSTEVLDAVRSLINRHIDIFLTSGDNTVMTSTESIAELLKQHKIPYFTNVPSDIKLGSLVSIGADYIEVGKETARMAKRVIEGEAPRDIPIENYAPDKVHINLELAKEYGIEIPRRLLDRAANLKK